LKVLQGGADEKPRRIYAPVLYIASLTMGTGPRVLLEAFTEAAWKNRTFSPSQKRLGQLVHRDARTVRRWIRVLVARHFVVAERRGRGRTNRYRLTHKFWGRIVAGNRARVPAELHGSLRRLGLKMGVDPGTIDRRLGRRPR
jgi:hypothetical protein